MNIENIHDLVEVGKNNIKNTLSDFSEFILDYGVLQIGIAFVIGVQLNRLTTDFVDNIIAPIIDRFTKNDEVNLRRKKLEVFGIEFELGNFIVSLINFFLLMIILFYIFKIIGGKKHHLNKK